MWVLVLLSNNKEAVTSNSSSLEPLHALRPKCEAFILFSSFFEDLDASRKHTTHVQLKFSCLFLLFQLLWLLSCLCSQPGVIHPVHHGLLSRMHHHCVLQGRHRGPVRTPLVLIVSSSFYLHTIKPSLFVVHLSAVSLLCILFSSKFSPRLFWI